jgi:hypothetical protein
MVGMKTTEIVRHFGEAASTQYKLGTSELKALAYNAREIRGTHGTVTALA